MAKELPEDLVTQILLCLPVVSLLRFKSVCKSWYALITHQNFIRKHLLHNKNKQHPLLLQMRDETTRSYVVSTLSYETLQCPLHNLYLHRLLDRQGSYFYRGFLQWSRLSPRFTIN
ncbi:hypothetical protein SLA2020_527580 [Shorea laevis]